MVGYVLNLGKSVWFCSYICRPSFRQIANVQDFACADETAMAFGSLISTCNMIESDIVTVISDVHLIWTTEIRYQS